MASDGKFGTFGGVFTPSILTILGVIMYLRLPWVVGQAGLYEALAVILAAHVVSVSTGLSISSIATDKKVGVGGPYYVISRSFGLPIGGAIGLALFLGLSFSISLYIVGFSESMLGAIGIAPTANAIRVCGSITIIAITVITFISTSLAIKTQYLILLLIAVSLAAIFFGRSTTPAPHLSAAAGSPSFAVLFGIFFPAVTGFTAGVNMSGDLRDPKTSIPKGTMLAIAAGMAVYVGLAVYLALRVDPEALRKDPEVLQHGAVWGPAVIAGIWGATLSSALGSILGAPRILQAMSADRITPKVFAAGYGPTNEPRNALFLAFVIGEAGILIAQLDVIARVVSMVFLALYTAINVTCAIESWASPDFRPRFRIPKLVSIVGAFSALLLMIELDIVAMLGATVLMLSLFGYLQRRQLTLEAGDTWEGIWSTVVRTGLKRLHDKQGEGRNWRPNVLLFDEAGHAKHAAIREFATSLASGNGMVTDFALARTREPAGDAAAPAADAAPAHVGVFEARIVTTSPLETIATICQHHGFSGVPPNTALLPWRQHAAEPEAYLRALNAAADRGLNLLLFDDPRSAARNARRRIDVWWAPEAGNLALSVALARFITRAPEWERSQITVLIVGDGGDGDELLRAKATRFLDERRLDARIRLVVRPRGEGLHDVVCNESRPADLVLVGLPDDLAGADRASLDRLERVAALPGGVVMLRASAAFADVLTAPRAARAPSSGDGAAVAAEDAEARAAEPLPLPSHPELAEVATRVAEHTRAQLGRLHDRVGAAIGPYLALCATARELAARRADQMIAAARERNPAKRRRLVNRATSAFLVDAARALGEVEDDEVAAQAALLADELRALARPGAALPDGMPPVIHIERPRADFKPADGESRTLRRWKRRRRWRSFYRRRIGQAIAVGALATADHDRIVRDEVARMIARFRTTSHDLAVEVGRVLASAEWKAHAQLARTALADAEADGLAERLTEARETTLRRLDAIREHSRQRIAEHRTALDAAAHDAARRLCATLDKVEAPVIARAAGRRDREAVAAIAGLPAAAEAWRDRQLHLLKRTRLAQRLARFRNRLTAAAGRHLEEIAAGVHGSGLRACTTLRDALAARAPGDPVPAVADELPYDPAPAVARLARAAAGMTGELPETETLLSDEAAAALVRGDASIDTTTVPVRSSVQGLVETDLIARLGAEAMRFAEADARAWSVARDSVLLLAARPREDDDDDEPAAGETGPEDEARGRLDGEIAHLAEVEAGFGDAMLGGLEAIAAATQLDTLGAALEARGARAAQGRPSRLRALARRGVAGVRDLAARAVYRRSAGVVYAHETHAARARAADHAIRELAGRAAAAPAVLGALPLYYRNLFTGQININEAFFVGRADKVAAGAAVLAGERPGGLRTVLVSGARGAGKTTLCQQIATAAGGPVLWLSAPPGGAATRAAFRAALEATTGATGTPAQVAARLEPGSVIVVDDLDLWWERRAGGLEAIDEILELVEATGDEVGFVLAGGDAATRVLGQLRPLDRVADTHLGCQPLTARQLDQVIMARHTSTGLRLKLARRRRRLVGAGEGLGPWARARLFDAHFDYSGGNVGYALRAWVAHVDGFADGLLQIRPPQLLDWDAIDDLRPDLVAVLVELVLHKHANADKLVRLTGRGDADVAEAIAELCAIGLALQNRRRIVQINPFVHVPVRAWLTRRELA